jgi:23S rRNA (adenine2503-C2)-methyltransferase
MDAARPHVLSLTPDELAAHAARAGIDLPLDAARRLTARAFEPHVHRDPLVAKRKREALARVTRAERPALVERAEDPADRFVKYLFRAADGALFEAVRIPLEKPGRFTVCLSSQIGCAMACAFCATGRLGLARNLEAAEMLASFLAVRDEAPGRVTGVVFQGQGEPFQNYDEVMRAAGMLCHPCGGRVAGRNITISTVGIASAIRRYAREGHPYRLIVSITTALAERRKRLLPIASRQPFEELCDAVREYAERSGRRVTLAWVLCGGDNHDEAEVRALAHHFAGVPILVNLIDVNDPRPDGFRRASDAERSAFFDALQALRAPIVRRYSGGAARHAACGMLASVACAQGG